MTHDYEFANNVVTDVAHYDNGNQGPKPCHLVYYPVGFADFQKQKPDIVAGLPTADKAMANAALIGEATAAVGALSIEGEAGAAAAAGESTISRVDELMAAGHILPIRFPDPGKPDGIRTYRKPIMTLKNVKFRYPNTEKWVLSDASVTVTLGSRVVMLGANGAGKSTFLKLLVGDLDIDKSDGDTGELWVHHNLRLSYIAQHSLHHLEEFLDASPMAYIQERFRFGLDRQISKLKTMQLTAEEKEHMGTIGAVCDVTGRQMRGKTLWYEVEKTGRKKLDRQWYPLSDIEKLFQPYVKKLMHNYDEKKKAIDSGMDLRPITAEETLKHLADFGASAGTLMGSCALKAGTSCAETRHAHL